MSSALAFIVLASEEAAEPSKTAFYILGGALAAWAVVIGAVGVTQPGFPNATQGKAVGAITTLLVIATMAAIILTA